jgi:hypothetical protein
VKRKTTVVVATIAAGLTGLVAASSPQVPAAAATPGCPPGVSVPIYCAPPQITATMQWTFFFAPKYTKVLSLLLNNAAHDTVLVKCSGRGCPYRKHSAVVTTTKPCGKKHTRRCPTHGSLVLAPSFKNKHLSVGSKLSIAIMRSGWIGKYYLFTIRAGRPPRIAINCLAVGSSVPTASGC